ncbi:MAG TPA: zf-TFIIB domain-containing protein [Candidatus Sumerlaeota bacterium]|nr:MAG: hypothetical protein BWZ08_01721 [candidate division BRC1 bacterium ADurb.BinA292]HOE95089.1 zf-TFIIB domain-containing protein [Candidatus Sumerlaeota bacterium]HOR26412.1 zf-TFIIB domain-containing protein [Candidatus Sumerlaeota bacterium]HPK01888.1 zf-TFIIB domain-containing protein [Candidatus Sumerlaeota bacterium]
MCPHCGAPMLVLELHGVEIDHCPQCGGTWLDGGELEQICDLAGAPPGPLTAALNAGRRGRRGARRCPRCGWRCRGLTLAAEPPLELDHCPRGHGLWFDAGEIRRLIEHAGGDEAGALADFLGDVLATEFRSERGPRNFLPSAAEPPRQEG